MVKTDSEIGAKNLRKLCAMFTDHDNSGLEIIHGLLDQVMKKLDIPFDKENGYSIVECNENTFFPGRQVKVYYKGQEAGIFGCLHPQVLKNFVWRHPVSALELNLEVLQAAYFE